MSRHDTQPTISDLRLERYRLGELDPAERHAISDRLAADQDLRARLSSLERSDREIATRHPAREMAETIRRRSAAEARLDRAGRQAERGGPAWRSAWLPALATSASVCILAVAALVWLRPPSVEETTIKGGDASLVIHRRVGQGSEELGRGGVARRGDELRIGYRAAGRAFGAILSIDGGGTLTQHLPRDGNRAVALQASGTVFLDFAYELDDAPRWEVFFLVTSDAPFDLEPVRRAARRAAGAGPAAPGTLDLPGGLAQFAFPLTKDIR